MPNSADITGASSNILLVGDSGMRKTRLLASIPGVFVYDFDRGMASTRDLKAEYRTFRDSPKGWQVTKSQNDLGLYEWGYGWGQFFNHLNQIGSEIDKGTFKYTTVGLDSLTFLSEMAMNDVLRQTKQDQPHQGSYGAQQQYIKTVLSQLTTWPIRLVATAHIQRDKNDLTTNVEKLPLLTGKLAGLIGAFFDEVYFCETDSAGKFIIKTQSDSQMRQAKSRYNVPNNTPTDWAAISKYFEAPAPSSLKLG